MKKLKYRLEKRVVHGETTMVKVYPLLGECQTLTKPRYGRLSTGGNYLARDDKRRISNL